MRNAALGSAVLGRLWSQSERRLPLVLLLAALALVGVVSAVILIQGDLSDVDRWKTLGYPGVLFLSFLGSFAMVLPVPGLIAVCGAGGLELNLIAVGLLSGTGEAIGELSGYAVGLGGRGVVEHSRFRSVMQSIMRRRVLLVTLFVLLFPAFPALLLLYRYSDRLEEWMQRRGMLVLFLISIIPNPVFDLVGIAAGGARYPLVKFLATVWVGKVLKGLIVGYTCFYGVTLMPWVD